ncbi:MAG: DNA-binding protein [Gemmataceae bacterium]
MTTLTLTIPDTVFAQFEASACRDGRPPETLLSEQLEHLLTLGDEGIDPATDHLLKNNAAFYRRLA